MSPRVVPNLVTLEELGAEMGGAPVEVALARLPARVAPVTDWQGRLCVSDEVAAKMLGAWQEEVAEAEARRARYDAYVRDRDEARRAVGQEAAEKAMRSFFEASSRELRESYAAFVGTPQLRGSSAELAAGREARREALIEFDAKHPPISFERWRG